jgi:hypothetical protein
MRKKTPQSEFPIARGEPGAYALGNTFPVVGIGASASGLDVFSRLLKASVLIADRARNDMVKLLRRLQHGQIVPPGEVWCRAKGGRVVKDRLSTSALLDDKGKLHAIAITEWEEK